jgi:hypothetical protein
MRLRRCNEKIRYIPRRIILGAGISEIIRFIVKSCEPQGRDRGSLPDVLCVEVVRRLNFAKIRQSHFFLSILVDSMECDVANYCTTSKPISGPL